MERLKVFADAHVFDGIHQGTRSFLLGLYRELSKYPDIDILLGAHDIDHLEACFNGSDVRTVRYRSKSRWSRLAFDIPNIIRSGKVDVAHFQYIAPPIKTCRFIVTTHDAIFNDHPEYFSWSYRQRKNYLYGRAARSADLITTVSNASAVSINKWFGVPQHRIATVPNGVDTAYFENYSKTEAKQQVWSLYGFEKYVLNVSRIEARKNQLLLIKSFLESGMQNCGYHLVLAGASSMPVPELDMFVRDLDEKTRSSIFFAGDVTDEDLLTLYRGADLFVYPSAAEGFGIPPLEAGACGIPVICSKASAMADFSFFSPAIFDPRDKNVLTDLLRRFQLEKIDHARLNNIRLIIRETYNWRSAAEKFHAALQNLYLKKRPAHDTTRHA